jgi:hypothetical protein
MQELDRRHEGWIEKRSLLLEISVIVLILIEIILSVYGIRLAITEAKADAIVMDKQNTILNNLQTSTQATASLLGQELDLEYTLAINVEYDGGDYIRVFNNSRAEASLAGINVDGILARIKNGRPTVIADHNMVPINLTEYNPKLREKMTSSSGKPITFPIEIYLSNARGKEFIWRGHFTAGNSGRNMNGSPGGQLIPEPWNQEVKKVVPTPSTNP